jgi:energy-coupling factor transporter ATP-binding protein EcfA2
LSFVDAMLPDGSRLHVVIPDITRQHWSVNVRKFVVRATHLDDLVQLGTVSSQCARFLEAAVSSGLNILVSGGTQAGKTTLLNCLGAAIPTRERVVTCEEVFELKIPLPDVVSMQCRQPSLEGTGEIKLRRLVKEALRMRPSRMIVGEVRQEESLDLLIALKSESCRLPLPRSSPVVCCVRLTTHDFLGRCTSRSCCSTESTSLSVGNTHDGRTTHGTATSRRNLRQLPARRARPPGVPGVPPVDREHSDRAAATTVR